MKLSKKTILLNSFSRFASLFVGLFFLAALSPTATSAVVFSGILPLFIVSIGYEALYWKRYSYYFSENELRIESGVITRNELDIPLRRIQNVDIERGIFQRILNLAEVRIETAGGNRSEAVLRYLTLDEARDVQERLEQKRNRRQKEDGAEVEELYSLSNRNLLLLSVMSMSKVAIGILALITFFGGTAVISFARDMVQTFGTEVFLSFSIVSLGIFFWITSILYVILKYYRFELEFKENSLEFERGLITRSGGSIPREKVQTVIFEENFLKRFLGYATLKVETAGIGSLDGSAGTTVIKPLAKKDEIMATAENLGHSQPENISKITDRSRKRYFRRYLLFGSILSVIGLLIYITYQSVMLLAISVSILLLSKKMASLKWENIGYSEGEDLIMVRQGFWNRKTYILPYFRIQNFISTETPFQRRWDLGTLTLDTAGSGLTNPSIPDLDREELKDVKKRFYNQFSHSF